jgi:hypothetical protein
VQGVVERCRKGMVSEGGVGGERCFRGRGEGRWVGNVPPVVYAYNCGGVGGKEESWNGGVGGAEMDASWRKMDNERVRWGSEMMGVIDARMSLACLLKKREKKDKDIRDSGTRKGRIEPQSQLSIRWAEI